MTGAPRGRHVHAGLESHRVDAMIENVDDLLAMGEHLDHALARVGMGRDHYDKAKRDRAKAAATKEAARG